MGQPARQCDVHAPDGLPRHRDARRDFARRAIRGLSLRSGRTVQPLVESGGHRPLRKPHEGPAHAVLQLPGPSGWASREMGAKCLRDRRQTRADAVDRRHAATVPAADGTAAVWSPDGTRLVYVQGIDGDPIFVADARGSNAREIFKDQRGVAQSQSRLGTRRSVDLFRARAGCVGRDGGVAHRLSGGAPERITRQGAAITYIAPLGPRTLLYVAPAEDRSGPWLWALDVESKVSRSAPAWVSTVQELWRRRAMDDGWWRR